MSFNTIDEAVCSYLDEAQKNYPKMYWVASSAGQCLRRQYRKRIGEPGKHTVNYSHRMQWYDGDGIHVKLQTLFQKLGILVEAEEPIIDEEYSFKGKPDAVLKLAEGLCLMDIKSQNQKAWARRKVKGERIVDEHHRKQVILYYHFLKKHKYPDLVSARIYYINRNSGEREEFVINISQEEIDERLNELKTLNEFLKAKTEPEKTSNTDDCYFCEFQEYCYGGPAPSKKYYHKKASSAETA
jgi:CRISPR/Cas system-associated exonuclease Cas4 (RecB family)